MDSIVFGNSADFNHPIVIPTIRVSRPPEAAPDSTMNEDWLTAVQDAIHETDPQLIDAKIRIAEAAIFDRMQNFIGSHDPLEEQALSDALGSIKILRSARRLSK